MKKNCKFLISVLLIVLSLSIFPFSALAAPAENDKSSDPEVTESEKAKKSENEPEEKAPVRKDEGGKNSDASEKPKTLTVAEGETVYAQPGNIIFNNGGTVYNNDAIVYNNGGIVYNNLGTVYNNAGMVFANGGKVYNNAGTVYDNGAEILSPEAEIEAEAPENLPAIPESEVKEGYYKLDFADDYSTYIEFEGQDEADVFYIAEDESFEFKLLPGYGLKSYELSSGEFTDNKDGSYTIKKVSKDAELKLEFTLEAPVMSLENGTYFESQKLEIKSAEGADIYYTSDGSEPDENSTKYSEAIELKEGAVIKAVAVEKNLENSKISEAKIAIVEIDVPGFKKVKNGYDTVEAKAIEFENHGLADASIKKLSLSGENASSFKLSSTSGKTVRKGSSEKEFWTICPVSGLDAGEYSAALIVESGSGQKAEFEITFTVK